MKASIIKKFLIAAVILMFGTTAPALADHIDPAGPPPFTLTASAVGSELGHTPNWANQDGASDHIFLGVWDGIQDTVGNVEAILAWLGIDVEGLFLIGKHETDGSSTIDAFVISDNGLSVQGFWSYSGVDGEVILWTMKAGNQFALYLLADPFEPGKDYFWSTEDMTVGQGEQPQLSHMSLFGGDESTPVPEPASLLLLGIGLLAGVLLLPRFQS